LDKTNHFFFDEFHIETTPLSWAKQSRQYKVRITVHKRYGAYGKIEEKIGRVDLSGSLVGSNGLYVLKGAARAKFTNKQGAPIVDLIVGFPAAKKKKRQQIGSRPVGGNTGKPQRVLSQRAKTRKNYARRVQPVQRVVKPGIAQYRQMAPRGVSDQMKQQTNLKNNGSIRLNKRSAIATPKPKPTVKDAKNDWQTM